MNNKKSEIDEELIKEKKNKCSNCTNCVCEVEKPVNSKIKRKFGLSENTRILME
jgi:hypothetical protein